MPEGNLFVAVNGEKGRGSAGNHCHARINTIAVKIRGPFHRPELDYTTRGTAFVQFGQLDKPHAVKSAKSYPDSQRE